MGRLCGRRQNSQVFQREAAQQPVLCSKVTGSSVDGHKACMPMRLPQNNVDLRRKTSGAPEHHLPCSNCSSCQPQQGCYHSNSIASQRGPRPKSSVHCFRKRWLLKKCPPQPVWNSSVLREPGSRKERKGSWEAPTPGWDVRQETDTANSASARS